MAADVESVEAALRERNYTAFRIALCGYDDP